MKFISPPLVIWMSLGLIGFTSSAPLPDDLSEYRTVVTAVTTQVKGRPSVAADDGQTGYLGVNLTPDKKGKLQIAAIAADSPAEKAGLRVGDFLSRLDGRTVTTVDALRDQLQAHAPGDVLKLTVERKRKNFDLLATLDATSRPKKLAGERAVMGIQVGDNEDGDGVPISRVTADLPAARAGLKTNDVILKIDGIILNAGNKLTDIMSQRKPGDQVTMLVRRGETEFEKQIELAPDATAERGNGVNDPRTVWKKPLYRLAVIGVEFPDLKHNDKVPMGEWERALFSTGAYNSTNISGAKTYGSLNDYYLEQSCGALHVEGKVFDWVEVAKKRADYATAATIATKAAFLSEAMDALLKREGAKSMGDFDGVVFIYAGGRYPTSNRGSLFWPHRATVTYKNKRIPYFICAEGGKTMGNISVFCHEFGHMLGLPDLYARPENPGSEGLGIWDAMSNQAGNGRPQHFSAWDKEQLGWLKPAVIDPAVPQKLLLGPVEGSTNECFKVLLRPDGSEYLLLENRRKKGFDASLPAEGLLIWRVVGSRPILEESHGVEGPAGPRVFLSQVPYPTTSNNSYTPYTTPSSRSLLGGGHPVFITNIRQLTDGRIAFQVGYEYE